MKRFLYTSSACIYPEHKQLDPLNPGLREADAWPAHPQVRHRAKREQLERYAGVLPERQGQTLALTVLYVP